MAAYSFEALQANGKVHKGVVEADTARAARSLLRAQQLVPLVVTAISSVDAPATSLLQTNLFGGRVFNAMRLAVWTRQLASLLTAGLPLERALTALSNEAEDDKQRNLVAALRSDISGGSSFAKALAQYPSEFETISARVSKAATWHWCWSAWPLTLKSAWRSNRSWWLLRCTPPS